MLKKLNKAKGFFVTFLSLKSFQLGPKPWAPPGYAYESYLGKLIPLQNKTIWAVSGVEWNESFSLYIINLMC